MALFDPFEYLVGGGEDVFGKKPTVPDFPTLTAIGKETTAANVANFDANADLFGKANQFNTEQIKAMLEYAAPGASSIIDMQRQNIEDELAGKLPQGVQDFIQQSAASRATAGGYGGSGMAGNLGLRDLGLNSLAATQQGFNHAQQWLAAAQSRSPTLSISNAFFTPAQGYQHSTDKFQRDNYAANIAAAPDPSARGKYDTNMAILGMVLSAYGGGAGYQRANVQGGGNQPTPAWTGGGGGFPGLGGGGGGQWDYLNTPTSTGNYFGGWEPQTHTPGIAGDMYG